MPVYNMVQRSVKVLEIVRRPHENNSRGRSHSVNSFHIKRLLTIPALRVLKETSLGVVIGPRCNNLYEMVRCQSWKPAIRQPVVSILNDSGCCVAIDNRYRLT